MKVWMAAIPFRGHRLCLLPWRFCGWESPPSLKAGRKVPHLEASSVVSPSSSFLQQRAAPPRGWPGWPDSRWWTTSSHHRLLLEQTWWGGWCLDWGAEKRIRGCYELTEFHGWGSLLMTSVVLGLQPPTSQSRAVTLPSAPLSVGSTRTAMSSYTAFMLY